MDTEETRRMRYREVIQSFTLLDDVFMTVVFQDSLPCVNLVLRIILNRPNLRATRVVTQDTLKNLRGHDLRLDIHAFADGQEFNIEIQRAKKGAAPRRARYHSSIMDANALPEGADYEKLPESYVIFITETDVLGKGKPLYVNSSIVDEETPLGRLMHDFRCVQPEKMYYDILAERAGAFKNTEEGASHMSAKWEQMLKEEYEQGREQGRETERLFSIRRLMTELQLTVEKAMDVLAIPQSEWARYKAML